MSWAIRSVLFATSTQVKLPPNKIWTSVWPLLAVMSVLEDDEEEEEEAGRMTEGRFVGIGVITTAADALELLADPVAVDTLDEDPIVPGD